MWKPLHMQPLFKGVKYYSHSEKQNVSETLFENGICLPSGSNMNEIDQMRVIDCIRNSLGAMKVNQIIK